MIVNSKELVRVCLVEDDPLVIKSLSIPLKESARLWTYVSVDDLFSHTTDISGTPFDLIILDLRHSGDPSGRKSIDSIPELIQRWPDAVVLVASGVDDVESMRLCVSRGADRFVTKEGLLREIHQILSTAQAWRERRVTLDSLLAGDSAVLRSLKRDLFRIQTLAADVLIQGETGSGKEVAARALHMEGPFIGLNVTTVPADLFESTLFGHEKGAFSGAQMPSAGMISAANGGTLFLDEFQSLSFEHQGKLLRFLETREYFPVGSQKSKVFRGRVLFASNQDLQDLVNRGKFREDLFYRISQLTLKIPPLRMRRADIPGLVEKFLSQESASGRFRFSSEGLDFLMLEYEWPGNVRELRGLIRSLVGTSRIPVWGKTEIETTLGLELKKNLDLSFEAPSSATTNESFTVEWNEGLDENLDRLTNYMIHELSQKFEVLDMQKKLKLKKSRFYDLLRKRKVDA